MAKTITLFNAIIRDKTRITEVTVTDAMKQTGSLRGLKLYDVMTSDVDSLIKLLPRVTSPALTELDVVALHPSDFAQLATGIADFFGTAIGVEQSGNGRSIIRCPADDTDELIADIAVIFHWQPSTYDTMPVDEFLTWHKRALARNGQEE